MLKSHELAQTFSIFYFFSATEKILQKCRQIVDMKKDDGFSALHLAGLNGHRDVTNTLIVTVSFYAFTLEQNFHSIKL